MSILTKISILILTTAFDLGMSLSNKQELLVREILTASQLESVEDNRLLMAIISAESNYRTQVISSKKAYGLMQLTRPAVIDAAIECGLSQTIPMRELLDVHKNVTYGTCYLKKLIREQKGNYVEVLTIYNGGYRQLRYLRKGKRIAHETAQFIVEVMRKKEL